MRTEERTGNYLHMNNLFSSPGIFYDQYTRAISCKTDVGGGRDFAPKALKLNQGLHT
jgi:hypothetical protein